MRRFSLLLAPLLLLVTACQPSATRSASETSAGDPSVRFDSAGVREIIPPHVVVRTDGQPPMVTLPPEAAPRRVDIPPLPPQQPEPPPPPGGAAIEDDPLNSRPRVVQENGSLEGIEKIVKAKLIAEPGMGGIIVSSSPGGVIILSGTATENEKARAQVIAQSVEGVMKVENRIVVK